jgi:hypothetical protein
MKYSIVAIGAFAVTTSAVPQYGYPTTKPVVNVVRHPSSSRWLVGSRFADNGIDTFESCHYAR